MMVINVDWFFLSHRYEIALAAKKNGFEVHIATVITDKANESILKDFIVHPISMHRNKTGLFNSIKELYELYVLFQKINPDIVHLVTIKPNILGGLAARMANIKLVIIAVSGLGVVYSATGKLENLRRKLVSFSYKIVLKNKNLVVIFQNKNDEELLQKIGSLRQDQIYLIKGSGVDLDQYQESPIPTGGAIVMFASRLLINKGVREFIKAAYTLKSNENIEKDTRFVVVGDFDFDSRQNISPNEIENAVKEGTIEYWGFKKDMSEVLRSAHLVVLPSYYGEGVPKVLIEAAACGRAIVTTDHPGCRDAIIADVTGLLVQPKDHQALASAIEKLLLNPISYKSMGAQARIYAEKSFNQKDVVNEHIKIYNRLGGNINSGSL